VSNLTQRILVALVAIPLIVIVSMAGGWYFYGMVLLIAALGLREFYVLMETHGAHPQVRAGLLCGAGVVTSFFWERFREVVHAMIAPFTLGSTLQHGEGALVVLLLVCVLVVFVLELFRRNGSPILNIGATWAGVLYVSLFLGSCVGLRELFAPHNRHMFASLQQIDPVQVYSWGGLTVVTVFVALWACDTFAYFAGRFIGTHKLFERVSPNKTWEGAIAGYVGGVAVFLFSQNFLLTYMTVGSAFVCGSIIGVFGQIGDLVESLLKRDAGVKDSSALIPGHGGVLDRFDSLMFVSPLMYLYVKFVVL
jgi:phosphatidate cytidylyltransferase